MGNEWRQGKLGEIVDFRSGWRNSQDAVPYGQFPFFTCSTEILRHNEFDFDTEAIIMAGNNADARFHLQYYKGKFAARQRTYIITPKTKDTVCRFIFYLMQTLQPHFAAHSQGTTTKFVTIGILQNAPIVLPSLPEQQAIAHILGALDDKIELNRRMNETLEAMARALFKSWFVDFDLAHLPEGNPQSADVELQRPRLFLDEGDSLRSSKLPEGWKFKSLNEIAEFLNGLALQNYPPTGDEYLPVIKIAELRRGITESSDRASASLDRKYVVEDGEVLFSWSGSLEACIWCGGRGALNQHLFKVTSSTYPKWFFYLWIRQHLPEFQEIAAGKATTMGHIQRHHLSAAQVVAPPEITLQAMSQIMTPLYERIVTNNLESRTLASIRDLLLPKLLSGEIRVKEAAELVKVRVR